MLLKPILLDPDPVPTSPLPLDVTLVKSHCAVDSDDQDDLLTAYIMAAVQAFENTTHRSLIQRQHRWVLSELPVCPYYSVRLPRGRTVSVESIAYISDGDTTTLTGPSSTPAGTDYQEDLGGEDGGLVMPLRGESWPSTDLDVPAPVTITFTAGWQVGDLPQDIVNALLFLIRTSLDDARTDPIKAQENLKTFEALVSGHRLTRFY